MIPKSSTLFSGGHKYHRYFSTPNRKVKDEEGFAVLVHESLQLGYQAFLTGNDTQLTVKIAGPSGCAGCEKNPYAECYLDLAHAW